jgi:hypothetical protein
LSLSIYILPSKFIAVGLKYILPYEKYEVPCLMGFFIDVVGSLPRIRSISFFQLYELDMEK